MKSKASLRREKLRNEWWPGEDAWTGERDKGWFRAPRTIPLILALLSSKKLSGNLDASSVYIELLARHIDEGIIEMRDEDEHAYAAGFTGSRAIRSWQERMKILEKVGFIKSKPIGNRKYGAVLLVHPTVAVQHLYDKGKVDEVWWNTYRSRQSETKENTFEERLQEINASKALESLFLKA
jgi:hypothetical protein